MTDMMRNKMESHLRSLIAYHEGKGDKNIESIHLEQSLRISTQAEENP